MDVKYLRFLTVLSVIFIIFAVFSLWVANNVYNTEQFTKLTLQTYDQPEVKTAISTEAVDRILQDRPLLKQVAGGYLQSFVTGILGTDSMKSLFERSSNALHDYLLNDNRKEVTLSTGAFSTLVKPVVEAVSPQLADQLPKDLPTTITLVGGNSIPDLNQWLSPIVTVGPIVGLIGLIALPFLIYLEKDRGRALKRIGLYLTVGSLVFMLIVPYFRMLLSARVNKPNASTVTLAFYDTFSRILIEYLLWVVLIAVILFALGYFWPKIGKEIKSLTKH